MENTREQDEEIDDVLSVVNRAKAEHYKRRDQKARRATKSRKAGDVKAAWQSAITSATFDGDKLPFTVPTGKEIGIFKRHFKRYVRDGDILEFLQRCINSWDDLKFGPMSWHEKMPRRPDFGFIGMNMRFFLQGLGELARSEDFRKVGEEPPKRERRNWRDVKRED